MLMVVIVLVGVVAVMGQRREGVKPMKDLPSSCSQLGKCCQGKNNTCQVQIGGSVNEARVKSKLVGGLSNKTSFCFCDSSCAALDDCCADYHNFCRPQDCVLAEEWDEWSKCDIQCGNGIKTRSKQVLQEPLNGGKKCGRVSEKVRCEGLNCKRGRDSYMKLKDTAYIISGRHSKWRVSSEYHPHKGIRKNIFEHYHANETERPSHCVVFQMTKVTKGCNLSNKQLTDLGFNDADLSFFTSSLALDKQVCVECQDLAMKEGLGGQCGGEGLVNQETGWSITPSCKGKWKMITRTENCSCDHKGDEETPDFLFV